MPGHEGAGLSRSASRRLARRRGDPVAWGRRHHRLHVAPAGDARTSRADLPRRSGDRARTRRRRSRPRQPVRRGQPTAAAAAAGVAGKYASALDTLTKSDDEIAQARTLRDELPPGVDVSTLNQWLDLNAAYDKSLRKLYQALTDSKGLVNPKVQAAFAAEKAARAALPADTKGLVVILAEIGRGGLNQAVITIEEARGDLEAAVGLLTAAP